MGRWRGGKVGVRTRPEVERGGGGERGEKGGRKGARKQTRKTLILVPLWFRYSLVAFQAFLPLPWRWIIDQDVKVRMRNLERYILAPSKKITYAKNSGGITFGAIATIQRNQLRKRILQEIFSMELRKFRVTQHWRVCCLSSHQLHKIILGELIS